MALELLSKYGWKGLYLGWSARLIQYTIQSALTLVVIEEFHLMFAKTNIWAAMFDKWSGFEGY